MAVANCVFKLLHIYLLLNYIVKGTYTYRILNYPDDGEIQILANENLELECEGDAEPEWSTPKERGETYDSQSTIRAEFKGDDGYKFSSLLSITNASYLDTGYYYCFEKGTVYENENNGRVAKIYLYVDDGSHLSISDSNPLFDADSISAVQNTDAVLPCRPTSPDINVTLSKLSGDVELEHVRYSPRIGFTIYVEGFEQEDDYNCLFTRGDRKYEFTIYLSVKPSVDKISPPYIEELSGGHVQMGHQLILRCSVRHMLPPEINFITPSRETSRMYLNNITRAQDDFSVHYIELTISDVTKEDHGLYTCVVKDPQANSNNNTIFVKIYDEGEHFIRLTEENEQYSIKTDVSSSVHWVIQVDAHPLPTLVWLDNKNRTITSDSTKYYTNQSNTEAFIQITNIAIEDRGYYTLIADNGYEQTTLRLFLDVTDKPNVHLSTQDFYLFNESYTLKCSVTGYPIPTVSWHYRSCVGDKCSFDLIPESYEEEVDDSTISSYLNFTSKQSGYIQCSAKNVLGYDTQVSSYCVTDVIDGFSIWEFNDMIQIPNNSELVLAKGETIALTCGASAYNYSDVTWRNESIAIDNSVGRVSIEKSSTEYSKRLKLTITGLLIEDSGIYECTSTDMSSPDKRQKTLKVSILVTDPVGPFINDTNMDEDEMVLFLHEQLTLTCFTFGIPKPKITWYKDGLEFDAASNGRIVFDDRKQVVRFVRNEAEDEGIYKCSADNGYGVKEKEISVRFKDKRIISPWYYLLIGILLLLLLVAIIILCVKNAKEKKLRRKLRLAGLENFEKGALDSLNPDLPVDDQAELLPYDKKWEFPKESLKLGKQLGSGAFGVVVKAEAFGIVDGEKSTTVAVKMVKKNADYTYIRALASELKIMVHLGKHINVVNLLGAVTKDVSKRELLVIVEYCRYGNLHNYLIKHRDGFINQIDDATGYIDYNIGGDILERTLSICSSGSSKTNQEQPVDYRANSSYSGRTANTETTEVWTACTTDPKGEEGMVLSNSSIQPEWRSNYKGDYRGNVKPICTKDLLTWAFQVARGMEYLASRRVLHGDLAARNILLADNNVVKICDFGLAKSMYNDDNYKKKGDGPLPVKWMAIESIVDRIFSTQSDVWSFGIVLWEFFSLAKTPYPGMEANERLYYKLVEGYRMECPEFATKELHRMMLDCWKAKPLARPSFSKLAERIGMMLEDSVRKHYIDLNDPYLVMNTQRLGDGHNDYLTMLSPPDFETISSPTYVNQESFIYPSLEQPAGYLCMKPGEIFSPREANSEIFTFDNRNEEDSTPGAELVPMLQVRTESDSGRTPSSPVAKSYANPSYGILPPDIKNCDSIYKTVDNYVNMPQNKNVAFKSEERLCRSHPEERFYVNAQV